MSPLRGLVLSAAVALPLSALAAGGHDAVGCVGCHSIHAAKDKIIFAVTANKQALNPRTKQPYTGTTALCLACHEESSRGGQGYAPVAGHVSHPFGLATVDPKIARVPQALLREGNRFECLGCHDPHPSNPNYKYLRVDTAKGSNMDAFCALCHSTKADASAVAASLAVFSSMDETNPPSRSVSDAPSGASKQPASAPKKGKK